MRPLISPERICDTIDGPALWCAWWLASRRASYELSRRFLRCEVRWLRCGSGAAAGGAAAGGVAGEGT